MSSFNNPRLITPPREEEDVYPYRPAWRSIVLEMGLLLVAVLVLFIPAEFLGFQLPESFHSTINVIMALLPAALWLVFSYLRERSVPEPRSQLLTVFIITALAANAIGIPVLEQVIRPEEWLPMQSTVDRIIGFMLTAGILQEIIKYTVVRFTVWPHRLRVREDAVAYAVTAAAGYALAANLNFVLHTSATPDVVAVRIFSQMSLQVAASLIVAYGLSETRFMSPFPILLPLTLFLSALVNGIAMPTRTGLINAQLGLTFSATRPLFGLAFAIAFLVGPALISWFLFSSAERHERDINIGQDL